MEIVRWSGADARAAIAGPDLDQRLGAAHGAPAVVVDLGNEVGDDVARALSRLPVVAIGHGAGAGSAWDVATTSLDEVLAGVSTAPQAAVLAAQVLRAREHVSGEPVSREQMLLVESLAYATLQAGPEFADWLAAQGRRVRNDDSARVRVGDDDGTAVVTLDRSRLHNLLDARMRDELVECLRALSHDPDRPIRLVGAGPSFCAGGDPAEFGTAADPTTAHLIRSSANVAPWLLTVAARTTAVVHGACVGAGVELASFCNRVVAHPGSRFRLPELRMGLMPGAGGTVSVPDRIGRQRTLEWLLTGAEIDAPTALEWGLVDEVTRDDDPST